MGGNGLVPTHVCAVPCARPGLGSCAVADEPADGGITIEGPRGLPWGPLARSSCLALGHPRLGIYAAPSSMAQMYRGGLAHRRGFSRGSQTLAGRGREGICKDVKKDSSTWRGTRGPVHTCIGAWVLSASWCARGGGVRKKLLHLGSPMKEAGVFASVDGSCGGA